MNTIYLLLGSNLYKPEAQLRLAEKMIAETIGRITQASSFYRTAPWGNTEQPDFVNRVLVAETLLNATTALKNILEIEKEMGRLRTVKNAPRIIDIDILYFNHEIVNSPFLTVPHPAIQDRRFVLIPLDEVDPGFIHPVLQKTTTELLASCPDVLNVQKI
ncbi:MAG: 2-amino-4-hydroxy-6-hydroxymethyldihydropteridine diphosphokinase [Ferruginibacter sp.]